VVLQWYDSQVGNEYVIRGNAGVLKCQVPPYVADLVLVDSWLDEDGRQLYIEGKRTNETNYRVIVRGLEDRERERLRDLIY
jgi:hypothetical protein